jgi:uncharacterized protein (TIGR03437 family)
MQSFISSRVRRGWFVIGSVLLALAAFPVWRLQAQQTPKAKAPVAALSHATDYGFITMRTPDGSACRPLKADEARKLRLNERHVELHYLGDQRLRRTQQTGLVIKLRGTSQLESFPLAKAAFERAAAKWQAAIRTPMTITMDVDYGPTRFGTPYDDPDIIGSTDPVFLQAADGPAFPNPYRFVRQAILDLTTDALQSAYISALPTTGLPTELGTTRNAGATLANFRGMELLDDTDLEEFPAPSIGFNSSIPYDFDPSDGIDSNKIDFETAAVHEIGHAMGFFSFAGFKEITPSMPIFPTPWDLLRFRGAPLDLNIVATRPRAMMAGGTQTYFIGDELELSTATPLQTSGDGRQASHWKDDLLSGNVVGIMDPTAVNGDRDETTFNDLNTLSFMGYDINPTTRAFDIQSIADASREEPQDRPNAMVVNRFLPSRYPVRLEGIRVYIAPGTDPVGSSIRIVAFVDNNRAGQPPASPTLLINQTVTIPLLPGSRYVEFRFATPPTINSGDVYLGVQSSAAAFRFAADTTRPQGRSFVSTNDGASWAPFNSLSNTSTGANFMARALFTAAYNAVPAPQTLGLSPSAIAPGATNVTLFVNGRNFRQNSVIRFNGTDRPTTYISNSRLSTPLQSADVASAGTANIRVFTAGGVESGAQTLTIGTNAPAPAITVLDPPTGQTGASGATVNVYGTNFTTASRVQVNGVERATTFRNSTQLEAALTAADLAGGGSLLLTVVTPAPGGGTSNTATFNVSSCNFSFTTGAGTAVTGLLLTSAATSTGFVLNTGNSICPWSVSSTESWLTLTSAANGMGRTVVNFAVAENATTRQRTANIRVNNQTFNITQAARATNVSAANYVGQFAPNQIVAAFGEGLAASTIVSTTIPPATQLGDTIVRVIDANNTARNAQLFFVSPMQVNYLMPAGTAAGTATVQVRVNGSLFADQRVTIGSIAPGLFTANANGQGVPAAQLLRIRGSQLIYEDVAVLEGGRWVPRALDIGPETDQLFLVLYGTGIRGVGGLDQVQLRLADLSAPALFAGAQGDLVGLDQINLNLTSLRASLRGRGEVNLTGTIGGIAINTATVRFQ